MSGTGADGSTSVVVEYEIGGKVYTGLVVGYPLYVEISPTACTQYAISSMRFPHVEFTSGFRKKKSFREMPLRMEILSQ